MRDTKGSLRDSVRRVSPRVATFVLLLALAVSATAMVAWAQNTIGGDGSDALTKQVDTFFLELQRAESREDLDPVFRRLLGSRYELQDSAVQNLISRTHELTTKKYGAARGNEMLDRRKVGEDIIMLRYLYKCELYPVVWHFTYYRPASDAEWTLVGVRFDTNLAMLTLVPPSSAAVSAGS